MHEIDSVNKSIDRKTLFEFVFGTTIQESKADKHVSN